MLAHLNAPFRLLDCVKKKKKKVCPEDWGWYSGADAVLVSLTSGCSCKIAGAVLGPGRAMSISVAALCFTAP